MSISIFGYNLLAPADNDMFAEKADCTLHGKRTAELVRVILPGDTEAEIAASVHDIMTAEEISSEYGERTLRLAENIRGSRKSIIKKIPHTDDAGRFLILADFFEQLVHLDEVLNGEGDDFWKKHNLDQKELNDFCSDMEKALSLYVLRFEESREMFIEAEDIMDDIFSKSYTSDDGLIMYREYYDGRCFTATPDDPMWLPAAEEISRKNRIATDRADSIIEDWYNILIAQDGDSCTED